VMLDEGDVHTVARVGIGEVATYVWYPVRCQKSSKTKYTR
jgi:hypothetical protein